MHVHVILLCPLLLRRGLHLPLLLRLLLLLHMRAPHPCMLRLDTVGSQAPRGSKSVKGGVSGLAEDLRPVSEVEAGVNFRPAGGVRGQVAGSLAGR